MCVRARALCDVINPPPPTPAFLRISSRYQIHTGLQHDIIHGGARQCLPPKFKTMGDAFSRLGYETHMIGKWHIGLYKDSCLPWNRGFSTYFGYLTGSEMHYTREQRTARASPWNSSVYVLYPDLRTESGPVVSDCIRPPLAPLPPPPPPCGMPNEPACKYSEYSGAIAAGGDIEVANLTVPQAKAKCSSNAKCFGFTFESTVAACTAARCKMYLKETSGSNSDPDWSTLTKYPRLPSAQGVAECYSTHVFTREAVKLIAHHDASNAAKPFFLYLAFQDVHEPVEVPAAYSDPFAATISDGIRKTYAGMVSVVDESLANVTAALKSNNKMMDNSIIVLSNDNGGWIGYGGINYPYRAHKTTLWEGGVRGLGWITAPGRISAGARFPHLFHVTDWLPTLVTAAGGDTTKLGNGFEGIDGKSQWDALTAGVHGDAEPPRTEILHNIDGIDGNGEAAIRVGDFKLLRKPGGADVWCDTCLRKDGCLAAGNKTVEYGGEICCEDPVVGGDCKGGDEPGPAKPSSNPDGYFLYNISADPRETNDLSLEMPAMLAKLVKRLAFYNSTNVPCCSCSSGGWVDVVEMGQPPVQGYWYSFHNQTDYTMTSVKGPPKIDPNCQLMHEPPEA